MKILFINCDGGGFADHLEVPDGTTVRQLFHQEVGGSNSSSYLIRVNRQPVPLRPGPAGGGPRQLHAHQDRGGLSPFGRSSSSQPPGRSASGRAVLAAFSVSPGDP